MNSAACVIGGRAKRDTLEISKEKLNWPGPSNYEGNVTQLYERMLRRNVQLNGKQAVNSAQFMSSSNSEKQLRLLKQKKQSMPDPPAPGRYEVERSERMVKKRTPQQAMGKTKRFSASGMDNLVTPAP